MTVRAGGKAVFAERKTRKRSKVELEGGGKRKKGLGKCFLRQGD